MDVLKFTHKGGDYDVIVKTDDISYAWSNFKGRIRYRNNLISGSGDEVSNPVKYCKYKAKDDVEFYIYNPEKPDNKEPETYNLKTDTELWPVVFETNKYQIVVKFHNVDADSKPKIIHIRKDVEKSFYSDHEDNTTEYRLTGNVDFVNEPGFFKLNFQYKKNGITKDSFVAFDVVSPKLDTKHDYKRILADVNHEFEGLIFNYLSTTFQQFGKGKEKNLEVWMQTFQQVVKEYIRNVERIIKNPHSKVRTLTQYAKADRIKFWTPAMEEEYEETRAAEKLDEHYFGYKQYETTVNSLENRFVKFTLKQIGGKLVEIFDKLLNKKDVADNFYAEWKGYQQQITKLQKHPFFKSVGRFEGLRQESLVLQSRMGYQQVYKDWLKLKKGIDFYNGATNIGTLQIWEIYELWCFLKVKNMVRELMGFDPSKPNSYYTDFIKEPNGPLVKYNKDDKKTDYRIEFIFPDIDHAADDYEYKDLLAKHSGEKVTLHYQHTFNRRREDDFNIQTLTTEQRPDIVLNIKKSDDMVLTYLYDAKYRVWSDKTMDKEFEELDVEEQKRLLEENAEVTDASQKVYGADYPPSDAINQMHRYRDAIYYGLDENKRPESKEIIGGYILFPGRGDDKKIKKRYFYQSIEKVNIGAFPLLPLSGDKDEQGRDVEGPQLWEHLKNILLEKEIAYSHVEKSVPQRGLQYVEATKSEKTKTGVLIMPTFMFETVRTMYSNGKLAAPLLLTDEGMTLLMNYSDIKYLIFYNKVNNEKYLFDVISSPLILERDDAENLGYYMNAYIAPDDEEGVYDVEPDYTYSDVKRFVCIQFDIDNEIDCHNLDPELAYDNQTEKNNPKYIDMEDIKSKEEERNLDKI